MNNNRQRQLRHIAECAMIAAIYAAATYLSALFGVAYGPVQFRFSEALSVLAMLTPAAIPGLTLGCALGNLTSPMGVWDVIFGSVATLLSALCARALRGLRLGRVPLPSLLMPVLFNALIVGAQITLLLPSGKAGFAAFLTAALEVGAGELAVCLILGLPLYFALLRTGLFKDSGVNKRDKA